MTIAVGVAKGVTQPRRVRGEACMARTFSKQALRNQLFKEFNSLEKIRTRAPGNCRNNLNSSNFSIVLSLLPSLAQTRYVTSCKVFRDDITSEKQDGFKDEEVLLPPDQKGGIFSWCTIHTS